ncbi:proline iminopeptidase-family hydrolase [Alicyclobacillus dauci]|uniref:Proline iminopeptidase n=1 Tax=Alicyclobacillus dauci TaxID=1475485 RepID=A0ABY6Z357_9BACL|nr:proline iminopeptidase-family hydrolase [Alicyclobacillus dauci]WAH36948.1 proline iminopeptidase-family hydrolase [Alicyclobacillus dauci]
MANASKIVPISGGFHVWTRRVGDSPIKMLLLHGGPGANHEYFEIFEDYLPPDGIEIYFYDQLGSYFSDQPNDPSLWNAHRFREEVEEVRRYLGLESFYLLGQSWGGALAIEYALEYQENLAGLIISNMTASIPSYLKYINALRDLLPKDIVDTMRAYEEKGDLDAPQYIDLVTEHLYKQHICRCDPWPDAVNRAFAHTNAQVYNTMQGAHEFVFTGNLKDWDRWPDLHKIHVPTLVVSGRHDSMNPADIEEMGRRIPNARVAICENGSHMSMWDDTEAYFRYIKDFVHAVAGQ